MQGMGLLTCIVFSSIVKLFICRTFFDILVLSSLYVSSFLKRQHTDWAPSIPGLSNVTVTGSRLFLPDDFYQYQLASTVYELDLLFCQLTLRSGQ